MIMVRIVGGLASQLHKYALGRAVSYRLGVPLQLDLTQLLNPPVTDTRYTYELAKFNIVATIATPRDVARLCGPRLYNRFAGWLRRRTGMHLPTRWVDISTLNPQSILTLPDNRYLFGEAAGDRLFRSIRPLLLEELQLRGPLSAPAAALEKEITRRDFPVSIHVRRGDFLSNPHAANFHEVTGVDYYLRAVKIIAEKHSNPTFLVFSDDTEWVRANLLPHLPPESEIVTNLDAAEDFYLMSICRGNIIANSGFSWTAAWASRWPDNLVISPSKWVKNIDTNNRLLEEMRQENWIYL